MGQLTNLYVSSSYQGLLKLTDSTTGLTATLQPVQDGLGGDSPLQISKTQVNISGSFSINNIPFSIVDTGSFVSTSSFNSFTSSIDNRVDGLEVETGSLQNQINQKLNTSSFNTYTSSNDSRVNSLISQTGSYVTETESGSFLITGSVAGDTLTFTKGNGSQFSLQVNTGSLPSGVVSGSQQIIDLGFATTGSVNQKLDTGSFNSYTSSNDSKVNSLIAGTGSYATTSSLTSLSQSIASTDLGQNNRLGSLEGKTGSYATTGSNNFVGQQNINGSVNVTGSVNITGTVTATSASFTYVNTVYETASVIYSSGSNQFGDASNDTQTLWGTVNLPSGPLSVTGSVIATNFTGSLQGTASYAVNALSASYAPDTTNTGSLVSNVTNGANPNEAVVTVTKGDGTTSNFTINNVTNANSSSYSNYAVSSSQAQNAVTASYANDINRTGLITTGSVSSVQSITGSLILSGSNGIELDVKGDQSITGSLNISGSVNINGKIINDAVNKGLFIVSSTDVYPAPYAHITSSNNNANIIFQPLTQNGTATGSIFISGSNNILTLGGFQVGASGRRGVVGSQNIIGSHFTVNTSSLTIPNLNSNIFLGAVNATLTTGSNAGNNAHSFSTNINTNTITWNHPSASIGAGASSTVSSNINVGAITSITPGPTILTTVASLSNNIVTNPSTNLNHISSSINFSQNIVGGNTITVNNRFFQTGSNNLLTATANIFGGQVIVVNAAGSPATNAGRTLVGNLIGGQTVNVSLEASNTDTGGLRNSFIYGQGLNVSGSHSAGSTNQNSITLVGRWNGEDNGLADSARTVFAVGTGTATGTRRTGLYVTSGSLVGVSGSLDVKGNSVMTGSLTVSGSFGSINGIGDVVLSGTTKMYETSGFPLQVFGTINSKRLHFNTNPFNSEPSSNLGALRFEGNNQQFYLTNYDIAQITTQSIVSTFVNTGSAYVETSLGSNNRGFDAYLKLTNAGGTGSLSTNVNTSITGSLDVSGDITIASGSGTNDLFMYGHKMFNVGAFTSTQTQSGSAAVSQSINYNITDISQGVSLNGGGTQMIFANAGTYNIQFSAQVLADTGADDVWFWLKKNGTNVSNSAGRITLANNEELMAAWNYVVDANAGDYYELVWESSGGDALLLFNTAAGNYPAVPSVITTVTQVR